MTKLNGTDGLRVLVKLWAVIRMPIDFSFCATLPYAVILKWDNVTKSRKLLNP